MSDDEKLICFKSKDYQELLTKLDELSRTLEEVETEYSILLGKYDELVEDLENNYKPINKYDFYGVNEREF